MPTTPTVKKTIKQKTDPDDGIHGAEAQLIRSNYCVKTSQPAMTRP